MHRVVIQFDELVDRGVCASSHGQPLVQRELVLPPREGALRHTVFKLAVCVSERTLVIAPGTGLECREVFPKLIQANTDPSSYDVLGRRYFINLVYEF